MAVSINEASLTELTTLPGIGAKFAQIIVSMREKKGAVTIDDFHETPNLQSKLNELAEKELLNIDYTANPQIEQSQTQAQSKLSSHELTTAATMLTKQMEIFMQVMEKNSVQSTKAITNAIQNLGSNLDKK